MKRLLLLTLLTPLILGAIRDINIYSPVAGGNYSGVDFNITWSYYDDFNTQGYYWYISVDWDGDGTFDRNIVEGFVSDSTTCTYYDVNTWECTYIVTLDQSWYSSNDWNLLVDDMNGEAAMEYVGPFMMDNDPPTIEYVFPYEDMHLICEWNSTSGQWERVVELNVVVKDLLDDGDLGIGIDKVIRYADSDQVVVDVGGATQYVYEENYTIPCTYDATLERYYDVVYFNIDANDTFGYLNGSSDGYYVHVTDDPMMDFEIRSPIDGSALANAYDFGYYYYSSRDDNIIFTVILDSNTRDYNLYFCPVVVQAGKDAGDITDPDVNCELITDTRSDINAWDVNYDLNYALVDTSKGPLYEIPVVVEDREGVWTREFVLYYAVIDFSPSNFPEFNYAGTTDWSTITDFTNADFNLEFSVAGVHGKIEFWNMNLVNLNFMEELADFNKGFAFSSSSLKRVLDLNTQKLPLLNVSARLYFYDLNEFTSEPGIAYKVGNEYYICGQNTDPACTDSIWNPDTKVLEFNVSHFSGFVIDGNAPALTIEYPSDATYYSLEVSWLGKISGKASDVETDINAVRISLQRVSDGTYLQADGSWNVTEVWLDANVWNSDWNYDLSGVTMSDSNYLLKVQAIDDANNITETSLWFWIDLQVPEFNKFDVKGNLSVTDQNDLLGSGSVEFNIIVYDPESIPGGASGISEVSLVIKDEVSGKYWNGSSWVTSQVEVRANYDSNYQCDGNTCIIYTYKFDQTSRDYKLDVSVRVKDEAGNKAEMHLTVGTNTNAKIILDNIPPSGVFCGNRICESGEYYSTCPIDCAPPIRISIKERAKSYASNIMKKEFYDELPLILKEVIEKAYEGKLEDYRKMILNVWKEKEEKEEKGVSRERLREYERRIGRKIKESKRVETRTLKFRVQVYGGAMKIYTKFEAKSESALIMIIPKELAESVDDILEIAEGYKVIESDPVIMWEDKDGYVVFEGDVNTELIEVGAVTFEAPVEEKPPEEKPPEEITPPPKEEKPPEREVKPPKEEIKPPEEKPLKEKKPAIGLEAIVFVALLVLVGAAIVLVRKKGLRIRKR